MTKPTIELVYFSGCPHVEAARANLRAALSDIGEEAVWSEWDTRDTEAPERVRGYSSPAVLVGGRHVLGDEPTASGATACSAQGAPPTAAITAAIHRTG